MSKKGGHTDEMLACTLLQESGGAGGDGMKGASGEWQGPRRWRSSASKS